MSKLLIDESPLQVLPSLAAAIGLNEAIIVQQIHYWLKQKQGKVHDGERWIYNSYEKWQEQFPFWSLATIQRAFTSAEKRGVLISRQADGFNRQKWYRINYAALESSIISKCDDAGSQNDTVSPSQNDTVLTEITKTTKTETTKPLTRQRETLSREPNEVYALANSLAEVCHMDFSANKGRLLREAKTLLTASPHPTPEIIKENYNGNPGAFWKSRDWRGLKGQSPNPTAIRETWGQWDKLSNDPTPTYKQNTSSHAAGNETNDEGARVAALLSRR